MMNVKELKNAAIEKGETALTAMKNNPVRTALGVVTVGGGVALCFAPVRAAVASAFTSYIAPFATASYLVMKGAFLKLAATHVVSVIAAAIGLSSLATLSLGIGLVALVTLGIMAYGVCKDNKSTVVYEYNRPNDKAGNTYFEKMNELAAERALRESTQEALPPATLKS